MEDVFSPVCDCAGNVDLGGSCWGLKGELGVAAHFSRIVRE